MASRVHIDAAMAKISRHSTADLRRMLIDTITSQEEWKILGKNAHGVTNNIVYYPSTAPRRTDTDAQMEPIKIDITKSETLDALHHFDDIVKLVS